MTTGIRPLGTYAIGTELVWPAGGGAASVLPTRIESTASVAAPVVARASVQAVSWARSM